MRSACSLMLVFFSLFSMKVALADDCSFAKESYKRYIEYCKGGPGGCSDEQRMREIVIRYCGPDAFAQPSSGPFAPEKATPEKAPKPKAAASQKAKDPLPSCEALHEIKGINFEQQWRAAVARITTNEELLRDLQQLKKELNSDLFWKASEWRELSAYLLKITSTVGNLTGNLLKFDPTTGALMSSAEKGTDLAAQLLRFAKAGSLTLKTINQALEQTAIEVLLDCAASRNAAALSVKTIYDMSKALNAISQMPGDFAGYRQELARQIENIDRTIRSTQQKVASARAWKELQDSILKALKENCNNEKNALRLP